MRACRSFARAGERVGVMAMVCCMHGALREASRAKVLAPIYAWIHISCRRREQKQNKIIIIKTLRVL